MVSGGLTCISGVLVDGEIRPLSLTILAHRVAAGFCETESKLTGAPLSSPKLDSWCRVSQTRPGAAQVLEGRMEMPIPNGENCKATSQRCAYQERSRIEDTFAISTNNTNIWLVPIYL